MSIFNLEQDGAVLLRDDLFKVRRHQCFISENDLEIKTFIIFHLKTMLQRNLTPIFN